VPIRAVFFGSGDGAGQFEAEHVLVEVAVPVEGSLAGRAAEPARTPVTRQ
jgi:hypothetical protein